MFCFIPVPHVFSGSSTGISICSRILRFKRGPFSWLPAARWRMFLPFLLHVGCILDETMAGRAWQTSKVPEHVFILAGHLASFLDQVSSEVTGSPATDRYLITARRPSYYL
ncbi:hypothetical protein F5X99DRAFT_367057 [Biscogniauxia marginata]|nr:hypothetical protein F5X99DRAFT_367057 [Biscogniauxia marginata]